MRERQAPSLDLGIKFNLETVDGLTIEARVTSAVSSGTGPDIISSINNWAQLYAESVATLKLAVTLVSR